MVNISFRDLNSPEDVADYVAGLNARWPERAQVVQHIVQQVNALPFPTPYVVELCSGPGMLAEVILQEAPSVRYLGLDYSEPLLAYARVRLAPFGDRVRLIHVDLNEDDWPGRLSGDINAIVSMQSLHDLGDESRVNRIYGISRSLLVPGGLLLNADLVVSPGQANPQNPGRRSVRRHLHLLRSHGYERVSCTLQLGEFGCCVAFAPAHSP